MDTYINKVKKIMSKTSLDARLYTIKIWFYLYAIFTKVKIIHIRKHKGCLVLKVKGTDCKWA